MANLHGRSVLQRLWQYVRHGRRAGSGLTAAAISPVGWDEKPLQPPEPKPPRLSSRFPHPRRRVALAEPEATFESSSTPPSGRSSPLLPLSGLCNSTPPAGRSISPRRHDGPIEPLWPVLEGPRFRISTAPVPPPPFCGSGGWFQCLVSAQSRSSKLLRC